MKLSFISLVLSAGLAISQVSASPLRVIVVSHSQALAPAHVHLGQGSNEMQPIPVYNSLATATADMNKQPKRKGCLKHKAMQATNWLRVSFGLPPLDQNEEKMNFGVLPIGMVDGKIPHHGHHHHQQHGVKFHIKHKSQSFVDRLTRALIMLGPWEGRAVAFVLGCGLGVLVRMLWVLTVVTVRAIRGRSEEDDVVDVLIFEEQEHLLPPPEYEQSEVPRDVKEKVEN